MIVAEGGLSILGVGVLPPARVVGQHDRRRSQPTCRRCRTIVFEPIVCIFLTVLSLNYLGDVVRARFDVRESAL